jgi:Peptidase C1-like family
MKVTQTAILLVMFCGNLFAQDIKITGTITQAVKVPSTSLPAKMSLKKNTGYTTKEIKLLKVQLSPHAQQNLSIRARNASTHSQQFAEKARNSARYPAKVELGMNNVPVLDQGMHGSCVTFACTAAVDAALNKGDYVSQLCQLELGNYLEKNGYTFSGWDGSWGRLVLNQMDVFGIVSKEQQQTQGCGSLKQYPIAELQPEDTISVEEYHQMSECINELIVWSPVLDVYQSFSDRIDINKTVDEVKAALNAGDRLTFGFLLLDFDLGFMGAIGKHKAEGDTWVLTPEIARDAYLTHNFGGHEMVITGYDDDALAIDNQGHEHRGLFILRNSWGNKVGDQGDFYMSYDYFKLFAIEVQRIRTTETDF